VTDAPEMPAPVASGALPRRRSRRLSTGEALGRVADLSGPAGLSALRVHRETLEPGHRSSPPHWHRGREEFVFVLDGRPSALVGDERFELAPGDLLAFPNRSGRPHSVRNDSDAPAELLVVSVEIGEDEVVYGD
jgi:uncharacterized cupin superfamily protein